MNSNQYNTEDLARQIEIIFGVEDGANHGVWWQTATDDKRGWTKDQKDPLAKNFFGSINKVKGKLEALSKQGAAVWWLAAEAKTRSIAGITALPCLRMEIDGQLPELPMQPTIINRTPNGYHLYFLVDGGIPKEQYPELVARAIHALSGDRAAKDTARVLRAVGFPHQKLGVPQNVTCEFAEHLSYSLGDLYEAFPPIPEEPKKDTGHLSLSIDPNFRLPEGDWVLVKYPKAAHLFAGGQLPHGDVSRGDMVLCKYAAIQSNDPQQMVSFMLRSARDRAKWHEKHFADGTTYLERLITDCLKDFVPLAPRRVISRDVESVCAKYLAEKDVVLDMIANRKVHNAVRSNYLSIVHGLFLLLADPDVKKEIIKGRLCVYCGWKEFCRRVQIDATKSRAYRDYISSVTGMTFVWENQVSYFTLPVTSPSEWLRCVSYLPMLSLAELKPNTKTKTISTRSTNRKNRTGTRINRVKAFKESGVAGLNAAILRDKRRKLVNKNYHRREFLRFGRDLKIARHLNGVGRWRGVHSCRINWLERQVAYHANLYNRLN